MEIEISDGREKHQLLAPLTDAQREILQALSSFPRQPGD
jgi:hypothetical protein